MVMLLTCEWTDENHPSQQDCPISTRAMANEMTTVAHAYAVRGQQDAIKILPGTTYLAHASSTI
jgi:hypothetical protein